MEWNGMEWNGMEWHGMAWHGMAWHGMEWNGMERCELNGTGWIRLLKIDARSSQIGAPGPPESTPEAARGGQIHPKSSQM